MAMLCTCFVGGLNLLSFKSLQPGSVMVWKPCYARDWRLRAEPFSVYSRVLGSGLHKSRTKAKKNGKGSITVAGWAFDHSGKK